MLQPRELLWRAGVEDFCGALRVDEFGHSSVFLFSLHIEVVLMRPPLSSGHGARLCILLARRHRCLVPHEI